MNLQDYPTPLTDEVERAESTSGYVDADFTRDLEQKLAACRDALELAMKHQYKGGWCAVEPTILKTLTLTAPQP